MNDERDLDRDLFDLAHAARASVLVTDDEIESALADVTSGTQVTRLRPVTERRRTWPAWAAAAAATVLVVGAGVYFLAGDRDERITTVEPTVPTTSPAPVTTVPAVPVTTLPAPTTVPAIGPSPTTPTSDPATAPPATTPASTTATTTTVVTTVPPATNPLLDGLYYEHAGIPRACDDTNACTQILHDPTGATISLDPITGAVRRHVADTGAGAEFVLPAGHYLVAAGPDDVVYVGEPMLDEVADVVAYSLSAGDAGRELRRYPGVLGLGDYDLVPSPTGLALIGWYGQGLHPADPPNVVIEYVDRDGNPVTSQQPPVRMDFYGITIEIGDRTWTFGDPLEGSHPSWPHFVPTFDGGFVAVYHHAADGRLAVVRGWADGTVDAWLAPDTAEPWSVVYPDPSGAILVPDGERFVRAELFSARPGDYWQGDRTYGAGVLETPGLDEYLDANDPWWETDAVGLANAIAGPPSSPAERRSIRVVAGDEPSIVVTTEGYLDDSVAATQLRIVLAPSDGTGLRVERVDWAQRCRPDRGQQDFGTDFCV